MQFNIWYSISRLISMQGGVKNLRLALGQKFTLFTIIGLLSFTRLGQYFQRQRAPQKFLLIFFLLTGCQNSSEIQPDSQTATAPPPTLTLQAPISVIAVPTIVSPLVEPLLETYEGPNSYRGENNFTVQYEVTKWRYENGEPFGRVLINLEIARCFLLLQADGNTPSTQIGEVALANRQWLILKPESDQLLLYRSSPFEFPLYYLAEEPTEESKNACSQAAEEVINRFQSSPNE